MSNFEWVKTIDQLECDYSNVNKITKKVNEYLEIGWKVLGIHHMGYDYTREGETSRFYLVYVLGHQNANAEKPQSKAHQFVPAGYE